MRVDAHGTDNLHANGIHGRSDRGGRRRSRGSLGDRDAALGDQGLLIVTHDATNRLLGDQASGRQLVTQVLATQALRARRLKEIADDLLLRSIFCRSAVSLERQLTLAIGAEDADEQVSAIWLLAKHFLGDDAASGGGCGVIHGRGGRSFNFGFLCHISFFLLLFVADSQSVI